MRKSSIVFMLLLVHSGYAQVKKGAVLLGPSFGFGQTKVQNSFSQQPDVNSSTRATTFNGSLRAGYFVTDKIALGILGIYSLNNGKSSTTGPNIIVNSSEFNTKTMSFGLFARSYKPFNENKFAFFGEFKGVYETGGSKSQGKSQSVGGPLLTNETTSDISGMELALSPGIAYFMTDRISLEASFGSLSFRNRSSQFYYKGEKTTKANDTNFNIAFNMLTFGALFYF